MDEHETEAIGGYELVAAHYRGKYCGVVWQLEEGGTKKQKIESIEGGSIAEVLELLRDKVSARLLARATSAEGSTPDIDAIASSFRKIAPRLSSAQIQMLKAHYSAPDRRCSATELAAAAGWRTYPPANLHYGKVGWWLYGEHPTVLPRDRATGRFIYTFMLADGVRKENEDWIWTMHPHIAEALRASSVLTLNMAA